MPTIHRKNGFRFFFYSSEGNEPPHIHIIGQGGEAKVWLQTGEFAYFYKLSPSQLKWLKAHIKQHVVEFLREWNDTFKRS